MKYITMVHKINSERSIISNSFFQLNIVEELQSN
jgi:hypothetical protein